MSKSRPTSSVRHGLRLLFGSREGELNALPDETQKVGLDESDSFWPVYVEEAEKFDKAQVESWNQDLEALLIFAGLYSAILTAFIIESRKGLQEDLQATSNVLLWQIVQSFNGTASGLNLNDIRSEAQVTWTSIFVNGMWFASLTTSLASALGAILGKEWLREYAKSIEHSGMPRADARRRHYRYQGTIKWHFATALEFIPVLLHVSFTLFFIGLIPFLWVDNVAVGAVVAALFGAMMLLYVIATILPLLFADCPFRTPVTTIILKIGFKFVRFVRGSTHRVSRTTPGDIEDFDASAIAWLLTTSTNRGHISTAAKSLPNIKGTLRQQSEILKQGGGHVVAGLVRSTVKGDSNRVSSPLKENAQELSAFLRAVERLSSRPSHAITVVDDWPFEEINKFIPQLVEDMNPNDDPHMVTLKANMILAYSHLSLRRYLRLTQRSRPEERLNPWSEPAALSVPLMKLIGVASQWVVHVTAADTVMTLRIIQALASLGAVLGPLEGGEYGFTAKLRMAGIYFGVLDSFPLPHPSLLHSSLLGIEGSLCRELPEVEFLDSPPPEVIMECISELLENATHPKSPWGLVGGPAELFTLVRRLHSPEQGVVVDANHIARLVRALGAFATSEDVVAASQATCTLLHLKADTSALDPKLDTLLQQLIQNEDSTRLEDDVFGTMFLALVARRPGLPRDVRRQLTQRCTVIISNSLEPPFTFVAGIMRGLTRLEYPEGDDATENGQSTALLAAVVTFFGRIVASDLAFELSLPALTLIRRLIERYPVTGATTFIQQGGFVSAGKMMALASFPEKNSPPLVPVLYSVISNIVGHDDDFVLDPAHLESLRTQLDETSLLQKIHKHPNVFAQVKASLEWHDLVERLENVIPGIVGVQELVVAFEEDVEH